MNIKNNKRSYDSKEKFKKSLLRLLEKKKSMNDISISEICKESGLNRSTFYAHYSVPYDILKEIEDDTLNNLDLHFNNINVHNAEMLDTLLSYIKENDYIFRILLIKTKNDEFIQKMLDLSFKQFGNFNRYVTDKKKLSYINTFVFEGSISVLTRWIKNDYDVTEKELSNTILKIIQSSISACC